jgi:hypothetical protein
MIHVFRGPATPETHRVRLNIFLPTLLPGIAIAPLRGAATAIIIEARRWTGGDGVASMDGTHP